MIERRADNSEMCGLIPLEATRYANYSVVREVFAKEFLTGSTPVIRSKYPHRGNTDQRLLSARKAVRLRLRILICRGRRTVLCLLCRTSRVRISLATPHMSVAQLAEAGNLKSPNVVVRIHGRAPIC